jgi:hypothetical protein
MKNQTLQSTYDNLYNSDVKHIEKNLRTLLKAKRQDAKARKTTM